MTQMTYKSYAFMPILPETRVRAGCDQCDVAMPDDVEVKFISAARKARFQELKGKLEDAKAQGSTHKRWKTVGGAGVRPSHQDANGKTVKIDDDFTVGGEKLFLPSDPKASFAETANCRCDVEFIGPDTRINGTRFGRRDACEIYNKAHQNYIHIRKNELKKQRQLRLEIMGIKDNLPARERELIKKQIVKFAVGSAASIPEKVFKIFVRNILIEAAINGWELTNNLIELAIEAAEAVNKKEYEILLSRDRVGDNEKDISKNYKEATENGCIVDPYIPESS